MKPNAAISQASIPGFSQEQSHSIRGLMTAFQIAMDQAFDQRFGPIQQPNPTPPLTSHARQKLPPLMLQELTRLSSHGCPF